MKAILTAGASVLALMIVVDPALAQALVDAVAPTSLTGGYYPPPPPPPPPPPVAVPGPVAGMGLLPIAGYLAYRLFRRTKTQS